MKVDWLIQDVRQIRVDEVGMGTLTEGVLIRKRYTLREKGPRRLCFQPTH